MIQHKPSTAHAATRPRGRVCLRKGCGAAFQPRVGNQRYCQQAFCRAEVRRWQARKRQQRRRQQQAHRQSHAEAEKQRRERRRQSRDPPAAKENDAKQARPVGQAGGAWSRSKDKNKNFCDRPGCYDPRRISLRAPACYCGEACRQAMRNVRDRERKWHSPKALAESLGPPEEAGRPPPTIRSKPPSATQAGGGTSGKTDAPPQAGRRL